MRYSNSYNKRGFTIVEMVVVVVIIGILASLTVIAYRGWQQGLAKSQVKSDLAMVMTAMDQAKNFGTTGYPTAVPSNISKGNDIDIEYKWGDGTKFCIEASSVKYSSVIFYIDSTQGKDAKAGTCPSAPFPPDEPNPSAVATSSSSITVTWSAVPNATSYTVKRWTGAASPVTSCTTGSTTCVISSLSAGTNYSISVTANNSYGTSLEGTTSATTQSSPAPATPSPTIASATSNSLTVTWPAVSGATCYVVRHGTGTPGSPTGCVSSGYTISGLSSATTYNVSVVASNTGGSSAAGTTSGTTPIPAPAGAGVTFTGPTYFKAGDGFYYYRYNVTASGGACSIGSTQWRIGVSPNPPTTSTFNGISWQSSNVRAVDVPANGFYSPTDVYIFAKPQCVSGSFATEGNYAATTYGTPSGI